LFLTDDLQNNVLKFVTGHGLHVHFSNMISIPNFYKRTALPHKMASALTSKSHELGNVNIQD